MRTREEFCHVIFSTKDIVYHANSYYKTLKNVIINF